MKFKQEVLNLLGNTIPFLNPSGQKIVRSTQYLAELFQSTYGLKAFDALNDLGDDVDTLTVDGKSKTTVNPFSLFLVLYLLLLATDHSPKKSTLAEEADLNPL